MNDMRQRRSAYRALSTAAERIGANNYHNGLQAHTRAGRKAHTYRYQPTAVHEMVIEAMSDVMGGKISPGAAMELLYVPEISAERFDTGEVVR